MFLFAQQDFFEKSSKIHNFGAKTKFFFRYFWGSTKFLIQWWWFYCPLDPALALYKSQKQIEKSKSKCKYVIALRMSEQRFSVINGISFELVKKVGIKIGIRKT